MRFLTIDLEAVERVAFNGDGPAFELMEAMYSVKREEGMDGFRVAPRVLLALLMRLAETSGTTGRISATSRGESGKSQAGR